MHLNKPLKKYQVMFFESIPSALFAQAEILDQSSRYDQLNIVIRSEGANNDPTLQALNDNIKVYAGNAWWLIHERRKTEGWYDNTQE